MIRRDYLNAISKGQLMSKRQEAAIIMSVFELLADAEPIFFKDGKWNPLKWNSVARWIKLAKLAYKFIKLVIQILK